MNDDQFVHAALRRVHSVSRKVSAVEGDSSFGKKNGPRPLDGEKDWPKRFPAKDHCSKCGLCETSLVTHVTDSCAFLNDGMKRIDALEPTFHGRSRTKDERHFGTSIQPVQLVKGTVHGGQWTGCVTSIALSMLETQKVDAVVCIADSSDSNNKFGEAQPIIAKTPQQVLQGRGVKPALAPSLKVLDDVQNDPTIKRLLFCGVGCAVQAFRSIQHTLDLEEVYVLGTNCADNSPTPEAAQQFLKDGVGIDTDANILGYEFMQDYRVHVKLQDKVDLNNDSTRYVEKPYFCLPGTIAKKLLQSHV